MSVGERLVVAQVRGLHGLHGTLRVEALTDRERERFGVGRTLYLEGSDEPLTIVESEPDARGWRVRFAEVADRDAAEKLRDSYLEAVVAPGEELPRGEYYWHQLVGVAVTDVDGTTLGKVADVYRAGGAEVLLVAGERGEIDVPVVRPVVRIFAPLRGEIVVDGEALGLRGGGPDSGSDAEPPDAEPPAAELPDAGPPNAEPPNAEPPNAEPPA